MHDTMEIGPWSYLLGTDDNGPYVFSAEADWPISKRSLDDNWEPQL